MASISIAIFNNWVEKNLEIYYDAGLGWEN